MANLNGLFGAIIAGSAISGAAHVQAADTYPSKPVRIVCPFPPGGGADSVARLLAEKFSERAGKPVVVDNRPGAGGNIGAGIVAKAAPDGYTLLQGSSSVLATGPALKRETYKTIADSYTPVLLISKSRKSNDSVRSIERR